MFICLAAIRIPTEEKITAVNAGANYLALGAQSGHLLLYKLYIKGINLTKFVWAKKVCGKYVSECAWSPLNTAKLATASYGRGISLFECRSDMDIAELGYLEGHKGVTFVKWSNESEHRLVSAGFDGQVRVWDTKTLTCTSLYQSSSIMLCAIFLPSDENYIMCSGKRETIFIFDSRNRMDTPKKCIFTFALHIYMVY